MADFGDMELYGDYNETEDDYRKKSGTFAKVLKILIVAVILFVVGFLVFRVAFSDYFPRAMKEVYASDALTAYCRENGEPEIYTQKLRASYDDPDDGKFFASHLQVIEPVGEVQITAKYNVAALGSVAQKYGTEPLDPDRTDYFTFRLRLHYSDGETDESQRDVTIDAPTAVLTDAALMYRYYKLVFDGVDFSDAPDGTALRYITLRVYFNGAADGEPLSEIGIWERDLDRKPYRLSEKERPAV